MTDDRERDELAVWAYEGEVFGEALFAALRDEATAPDEREEFEALRGLEAQTAAVARELLVRLGIDPPTADAATTNAHRARSALAATTRMQLLDLLAHGAAPAIERYERLAALLPDGERWVADELVAHEVALRDFADAARRGVNDPAAVVRAQMA